MARKSTHNVSIQVSAYNKASKPLNDVGKAAKNMSPELRRSAAAADALSVAAENMGGKLGLAVGSIGTLAGAVGAGGAVLAGLFSITKAAADAGDTVFDLSNRFGLSAESISRLGFVARQSGTDVETIADGIKDLSKNAATNATKMKQWGISIEDAGGNIKTTEQLFLDTVDAINKMPTALQRTAAAEELMGGAGSKMLQVINLGSEGIRELQAEADRLGVTISTETAVAANQFGNELAATNDAISGLKRSLGEELIPTVTFYTKQVKEVVVWAREWKKSAATLSAAIAPLIGAIEYNVLALQKIAEWGGAAKEETKDLSEAQVKTTVTSVAGAIGLNSYAEASKKAAEETKKLREEEEKRLESMDFGGGEDPMAEFQKWSDELAETEKTREEEYTGVFERNRERRIKIQNDHLTAIEAQLQEHWDKREEDEKKEEEERLERSKKNAQAIAGFVVSATGAWTTAFTSIIQGSENAEKAITEASIRSAEAAIRAAAASGAAEAAFSQAGIPIIGPALAIAASSLIFGLIRGFLTKMQAGGEITDGMVRGGIPGVDSVMVSAQRGEGFLSRDDVSLIRSFIRSAEAPGAGGGVKQVNTFQSYMPMVGAESQRAMREVKKGLKRLDRVRVG